MDIIALVSVSYAAEVWILADSRIILLVTPDLTMLPSMNFVQDVKRLTLLFAFFYLWYRVKDNIQLFDNQSF